MQRAETAVGSRSSARAGAGRGGRVGEGGDGQAAGSEQPRLATPRAGDYRAPLAPMPLCFVASLCRCSCLRCVFVCLCLLARTAVLSASPLSRQVSPVEDWRLRLPALGPNPRLAPARRSKAAPPGSPAQTIQGIQKLNAPGSPGSPGSSGKLQTMPLFASDWLTLLAVLLGVAAQAPSGRCVSPYIAHSLCKPEESSVLRCCRKWACRH